MKLYRVIHPVRDIDRAAAVYARLLGDPGERIRRKESLDGSARSGFGVAMAQARIEVERLKDNTFRVTVSDAGGRTVHNVTVDPAYYRRLTGGNVPQEELVSRSFEFLLEREPKESILGSFDLSVIFSLLQRIRSRDHTQSDVAWLLMSRW